MENGTDEDKNGNGNMSFNSSASSFEESSQECSDTTVLQRPVSSMQGRSVKEFEEQLTRLKKENFDLKLRIYFLEEKMGTNFTLDKNNIVKKYVDLQFDFENLRRELQEKEELLCQAVRAIDLEDEDHKKYVTDKENQIVFYRQEIEDLRNQLQDLKYNSEGTSVMSDIKTVFTSKFVNNQNLDNELQDKITLLENELQEEKETNASFQVIICQTESLKTRCDNMQKEIKAKDEIIKNLHQENESINEKITTCSNQVREMQEKLDAATLENQQLIKKVANDNKRIEELKIQFTEKHKKYTTVKADLEREYKKAVLLKSLEESRKHAMEDENEKLKTKYRESQAKLETALTEIRKNQNVAYRTQQHLQELRKRSHYTYR